MKFDHGPLLDPVFQRMLKIQTVYFFDIQIDGQISDRDVFGMEPNILFGVFRSSYPEVSCKKGVLRNFAKFAGKHLCQCLFFNQVAVLRLYWKRNLWTLLKETFMFSRHRCFAVNFAKFIRTPFIREHLWWLLNS